MNPPARPTMNPPVRPPRGRTVLAGSIYCIHTHDDPRAYVGQTGGPVGRRVDSHRLRQLWGHTIRPGRGGYHVVTRVESSGDPTRDEILLDLAEAIAIRDINPTFNDLRPDPTIFRNRLAAYDAGTLQAASQPSRRVPALSWGRVILATLWAVVALMVTAGGPNPTTPWVAVPIAIFVGPWITLRMFAKQPSRRRRARRGGRRRVRRR
jgi:hypothetical protein